MTLRIIFLTITLIVVISVEGRRVDIPSQELPLEARYGGGRGGSSCIIKKRSIEIDGEENDDDERARQASIGNGSIFIPSADEPYGEEEEEDEEEEEGSAEDDDFPLGYPPYGGYGGYGGGPGGMQPWEQDPMETSLSVSSEPNFGYGGYGGYPYMPYHGGTQHKEKHKKKRKNKDSKKGGNINCIIITKGKDRIVKKKPPSLLSFLPFLGGRRRDLSRSLRMMKGL